MQTMIVDADKTPTLALTMTVTLILTADYSTCREQFKKYIIRAIIYSKVQTFQRAD